MSKFDIDVDAILASCGVPIHSQEAFLSDGTKRNFKIIVTGKSVTRFHRHKWENVKWDENKFGPSVVDLPKEITKYSGFYATYQYHWRCTRCGREYIEAIRSFL